MTDLWELVCAGYGPHMTLTVPGRGYSAPMTAILRAAEGTAGHIEQVAAGRQPGRVGLLLDNGEPWVRGLLALWRLGATAVPLPLPAGFTGPAAYLAQVGDICADAGLDAILVDSSTVLAASLGRIGPALIDITDPMAGFAPPAGGARLRGSAVIQYTSGSTSRPKGVVLTQDNVMAGIEMLWRATGSRQGDSLGLWLPLYHDMGLFSLLSALVHGMSLSLWRPREFIRRPMEWLRQFAAAGCTTTTAPNFFYDILAEAAREGVPDDIDLSAWRIAVNGAEPVRPRTLAAFTEAFAGCGLRPGLLRPAYGLAEATLLVCMVPPGDEPRSLRLERSHTSAGARVRLAASDDDGARTVASCGRLVPPMRLRIRDGDGQDCPDGVVGEVQIAGPSVTAGYLGVEAPAQPFTCDGWLRTGDLAFMWEGEVYLVGRIKDMIVIRGVNYYPEDVEEVVRAVPEARGLCAAFAWVDEEDERIVVLWETQLGAEAAATTNVAIRGRIREHLGLDAVDVVAVPPRTIQVTSSGKVKRAQTREAWRGRPTGNDRDGSVSG